MVELEQHQLLLVGQFKQVMMEVPVVQEEINPQEVVEVPEVMVKHQQPLALRVEQVMMVYKLEQ